MMYPNLFSHYHPLKGSDWLCRISPEDRQAFSRIGFQASDYGKAGGKAFYKKYGREKMSELEKRGAFITNMRKWFVKKIQEEQEKNLL